MGVKEREECGREGETGGMGSEGSERTRVGREDELIGSAMKYWGRQGERERD